MKNKSNNIAFLFGAGISQPAGILKVSEITDNILKGENVVYLSGRWYFKDNNENFPWTKTEERLKGIISLFDIINNDLMQFYTQLNREMNYEDYYYIIDSINEDQMLNFENPIVTYYDQTLYQRFPNIFEEGIEGKNNQRLTDITSEAKKYIEDLVVNSLSKEPITLTHLDFLYDIEKDEDISNIYLFTLNHDIFLEKFFQNEKIEYSDGYVSKNEKCKIWNPDSFNLRVNILKLHGSIDWFYDSGSNWYDANYYKNLVVSRESGRPIILVGSFNKLNQYNRSIYFELLCLFAKKLESCNYLVVGGYSFGDQGINTRIIEWMFKDKQRKLIIIHNKEEELMLKSRSAIRNKWLELKKEDTILNVKKFIEIEDKVEWKEIKRLMTF